VSLRVIPLLQAFSSVTFRICDASRGPSASAELLVYTSKEMRGVRIPHSVWIELKV